MGCLLSKDNNNKKDEFSDFGGQSDGQKPIPRLKPGSTTAKKEYSWDKRRAEAQSEGTPFQQKVVDMIVTGQTGQSVVRSGGQVTGQQFMAEDCVGCVFAVVDRADSVVIESCRDCVVFLGPVAGSVFLRGCSGVRVVAACRQLRIRDCEGLDILLHCATLPVVESSKRVRFGCWSLGDLGAYPGYSAQLSQASMSPFSNFWSEIHDFTPSAGSWSLLPAATTMTSLLGEQDLAKFPTAEAGLRPLSAAQDPADLDARPVPHTLGRAASEPGIGALFLANVAPGGTTRAETEAGLHRLWTGAALSSDTTLVDVREVNLDKDKAQLLGLKEVAAGRLVAMEFKGGGDIRGRVELAAREAGLKEMAVLSTTEKRGSVALEQVFSKDWAGLF
jgi:hypothetical protein